MIKKDFLGSFSSCGVVGDDVTRRGYDSAFA